MDKLNIFFGVFTLASFGFSIYTYFKSKAKRELEIQKKAMQEEKIRSLHSSVISLLHTLDAMVQLPKKETFTIGQLQDMSRLARGQAFNLEKQFEDEFKKVTTWRYGELLSSSPYTDTDTDTEQK